MENSEPVSVEASQQAEDLTQEENDKQQKEDESETPAEVPSEKPKLTPEQARKELPTLKKMLLRQLRIVLMVGECHAQLGKQEDLNALVNHVVGVVKESKSVTVEDVMKEVEVLTKEASYLRALIAIQCACKLYKADKLPYEALFDIGDCANKVDDLYSKAAEKQSPALEAFCQINIHFMDDLANQLSDIEEAFEDLRVRVKVRCLGNKADCLGPLGREDEALQVYGECVDAMRQHFGDNASMNRYFGEFLNNIGHIYIKKRQFIMAQSYFEEALAARVMAQDFDTPAEKQEAIARLSSILTQIEQVVEREQAAQQPGPSGTSDQPSSSNANDQPGPSSAPDP